jgi:hypothetical protein
MGVAAGRIALPNIDRSAADRIAVQVNDPADYLDRLAHRHAIPPLYAGQVGIVIRWPNEGVKRAELLRRSWDKRLCSSGSRGSRQGNSTGYDVPSGNQHLGSPTRGAQGITPT